MEIPQIKQHLSLSQVLSHYGLEPNKNNMLNCPFHEDRRASLQVNLEKHFYKCHACGKKGDQIQWVQDYEKLSKHEALLKCASLVESWEAESPKSEISNPTTDTPKLTTKTDFLEKIFTTFRKSVYNSKPAQEYLESRVLDFKQIEVGFNAGQFHHGERRNEELIQNGLAYGLLIDKNLTARTGEKAYSVFGNKSIVFALRNQENQVVSFYFRSIVPPSGAEGGKHFYLKNRSGLYPNYPNPTTKKLILTESIIDAASLLQIEEINKNYSVLACYGTNGLTQEIQNAIKNLQQLEEIIFFFDGDAAGREAVKKYANQLKIENEKLKISNIEIPENEDINSLSQGHEPEIFTALLEKRKAIFFSNEVLKDKLLEIEDLDAVKDIPEGENIREIISQNPPPKVPNQEPITFLKSPNLLDNFGKTIGEIGIIGEERNRLLMLTVVTTYKMHYNLHILYQGSSGSGKTHTIQQIASLIPPEDTLYLTRVTDSSLYNFKSDQFMYKLIVFEDMDGLKEGALMAVREMISNKRLSSSTSVKDKRGNSDGKIKELEVSFSSLSATTKGELYEDNMSRIIVLSVDESKAQTQRIIAYKNQIYQGEIDKKEQERKRLFLRECIKLLQPYEVINPFASKIQLPENVHKPTRMHDLVMGVINQITILNQYQRKQKNGFLITEKEDVISGLKLMKESIVLKMDELEGKIRTFYEELKKYVTTKARKENKKATEIKFTRFDIKDEFLLSKAQINSYLYQLSSSEYLQKTGRVNKGFSYKIMHWDNFKNLSEEELERMFEKLNAS